MPILFALTILSSLVGGFFLLVSVSSPSGPGQASMAAIGCALAVIPYIICRSVQLIVDRQTAAKRHTQLLRALTERESAATRRT